jgi:hypothetical protein
MLGHDACIFKQYMLTKKLETQLVPKEEGQRVMTSAFQSTEYCNDVNGPTTLNGITWAEA